MLSDAIRYALPQLRSQARSLMGELVSIERATGQWTENEAGDQVPETGTVYRGCAALENKDVQVATPEVAGGTVTIQRQVLKLPADTPYVPREGDMVAFLEGSQTATLVGMQLRLTETLPVASNAVQYRVPAERT